MIPNVKINLIKPLNFRLKRLPRDGPEIKRILGTHLNTYPFSKGIGEYVLAKEAPDLPLIIHRPSMVTPTYSDPIEVRFALKQLCISNMKHWI